MLTAIINYLRGQAMNIDKNQLLTKIPKDFPESAIYVLGAVSPFITDKDVKLEDICILVNHPDQLKFVFEKTPTKEHPDAMTLHQMLAYAKLTSTKYFYQFIYDYLSDQKALDAGKIPKALTKEFWAFDHLKDAEKMRDQLIKNQDQYYDSLLQNAKPHANTQKIIVVDLTAKMMDFLRRVALPEITSDPKFIKQFKKNEADAQNKSADNN